MMVARRFYVMWIRPAENTDMCRYNEEKVLVELIKSSGSQPFSITDDTDMF